MNNPIFWRLVWKEYRLMRSFWIAMAVLTVILQLIACFSVWDANDRADFNFIVALTLPAFYALGCGATLFATEHETDTYQFQRALPVSASRLFYGKIPFGLISTPPLFLLLWVSAWLFSGMRLPHANLHLGLWGLCGVAALELFLWGVLFSLLCRQPLKAAVLATIFGSTTIHTIAMMGESRWVSDIYLQGGSIPYRLGVACILAAVNVWLGYRWLSNGSVSAADVPRLGRAATRRKAADIQRGKVATRSTILGRLVWQQWRQSRLMLVILVAMTVPLLVFMASNWSVFTAHGRGASRPSENLPFWIMLALAAAPLAGAGVFMADQRRSSFRFLTERGVNPRYVWIGRQAVWVFAVFGWGLLTILPWVLFPALSLLVRLETTWDSRAIEPLQEIAIGLAFVGAVCLAYAVGSYTAGQLSSMFFKSSLLAGFFAILFSIVLTFWSGLMLASGVPAIWSIAPIPLVLLVATWLRAPHWMLERNGVRGWLTTATWLTGTAVLLLAAVLAWRVYGIPKVFPGFAPEVAFQPASAEAQATADTYCRASELIVPIAKREDTSEEETGEESLARLKAWIDENRAVIETAMEASRRPECDGLEPPGRERLADAGRALTELLSRDAGLLASEGDLDAALERYLAALQIASHIRPRNRLPYWADSIEISVCKQLTSWAADPGQTPQRIQTAIEALERLMSQPPVHSDGIQAEYRVARQILEGDYVLLEAKLGDSDRKAQAVRTVVAMQWLPWERARAVRLLTWITADGLKQMRTMESELAEGRRLSMPSPYSLSHQWSQTNLRFARLSVTTMGLHSFYEPSWSWTARSCVDTATRRRATCLILALTAWKLEHGELPEKLDELVGPYLTKLPIDPHSGKPFRYFREGLPIPIEDTNAHSTEPTVLVNVGEPFIWSIGWHVTDRQSYSDSVLANYHIVEYQDRFRSPQSEYEIWQRGKCFTIP